VGEVAQWLAIHGDQMAKLMEEAAEELEG